MFDDTEEYFEYITYRRENRKIFTNAQQMAIEREDSEWAAKHTKYHLTKRVHAEGKAEGLAEGKTEGILDAAHKFLLAGSSAEDVANILDIELETVLELNV